jgi:hypothetical protein
VDMLTRVLTDWPADRVAAFTDLFGEFNDAVEAHLRSGPGSPPRENA